MSGESCGSGEHRETLATENGEGWDENLDEKVGGHLSSSGV